MNFTQAFDWMMEEPESRKIIEEKYQLIEKRFPEGPVHLFLKRNTGWSKYFCIIPFPMLKKFDEEEMVKHHHLFQGGKYENRIENLEKLCPDLLRYLTLQFSHLRQEKYAKFKSRIPSIKKNYPELSYGQIAIILVNYPPEKTTVKALERGVMKEIMDSGAMKFDPMLI
jgi:hypothetical protein